MKIKISSPPQRAREVAAEYARYSRSGILRRRVRLSGLAVLWKLALLLGGWGKRAVDLVLASVLLLALLPIAVAIVVVRCTTRQPLLARNQRIGRWGVPFELLTFQPNGLLKRVLRKARLDHLPTLWNVVRGDMSLIGPRPSRPEELDLRQRQARKRSSVRPGMVSLWWLRKSANIDFSSELDVDLEYINQQSVRGDFGIALRAIPAILYGFGTASAPDKVEMLGVPIRNITMEETLDHILLTAESNTPRQVCFVNTDCVNKAQNDAAYAAQLRACDVVLADGIGIRLAGKLLRQEIRQNVNGTDLFPLLCRRLQGSDVGLFLLGARPGVVEAVRDWVESNYPGTTVKGYHDGYFTDEEQPALLQEIRDSGARILLVGFGAPRQDMWIGKHLADTGVSIAMGVGGLFDFYSGRIPRAPQWMRELSLEWMYRLLQEPSRMWKRYLLGNVVFLSRVLWSMMRRRTAAASTECEVRRS
jgi:N-acetylglucosaminyldiphosphoundecaprenol N-acetyl-beta-D-mannosaminyltransferase